MREKLKELQNRIFKAVAAAETENELKGAEIKYLGRKSELSLILRGLSELKAEEKSIIGALANKIKLEVKEKLKERQTQIGTTGPTTVDITLPGRKLEGGSLHPVTLMLNELEEIFSSMGFMVLDGPELESDWYNFEALNILPDHPARDTQDTFYLDKPGLAGDYDLLMRTHTSPMQIRAMETYGAPLRCVVPGRVFRYEATDANHDNTFYQLEGLMIDRRISVANLVAVLKEVLTGIFRRDVKLRVRPGHFPFVEPGLEIDLRCTICGGDGCPSCKHEGWLEMLGAGLVHPNVLKNGGIDPAEYSGFAFGLGVDRLVMMKSGIRDIRLFHGGDLRFLKQF